MDTQSPLAAQLRSKEYRDEFVAAQIRVGLPMQCRALRESREWTQPQLADAAGMSQPRISEIERPGERRLNIETLLRLASAFDVALQVRFVPFSELVDDDDEVVYEDFYIAPFDEDMEALERLEAKLEDTLRMSDWIRKQAMGNPQENKPASGVTEANHVDRETEINTVSPASRGGGNKGISNAA